MRYLKSQLIETLTFLRQSQAYFKSVLIMHGFFLLICLPLLGKVSYFILVQNHIQFLAFSNLPMVIHQHPWAILALVTIALFILVLAFFEFTFLLFSVYAVHIKRRLSLQALLKLTFEQLKHTRLSTLFCFLCYYLLILPLGSLGYQSDLLAKLKLPAFILDYILTNRWFVVSLFIAVYLCLVYIGLRLICTLPYSMLQQLPLRQAIRRSWSLTKHHFTHLVGRLSMIGISLIGFTSLSFAILIGLQTLIEQHVQSGLISAVFIMTCLQMVILLNLVLSTVAIFFVIIAFLLTDSQFTAPQFSHSQLKLSVPLRGRWLLLSVSCCLLGGGLYNWHHLEATTIRQPISISHRGVTQNNGVQNTIAALKQTHRLNPDYVEMDVQFTKDHQFIVYHDAQLKSLTGTSGTPQSKTLAQLTQLTAHENQQQARVADFDDYLTTANHLHQKLLIEIKTPNNQPNRQLVKQFLTRYQATMEAHHHMVQSLNWQVVEAIKKAAPEIQTGYILPFNFFGPPTSHADFYAVEITTVTRHFIQAAHQEKKAVFVWTPNDKRAVQRTMAFDADGVVTDNLHAVDQAKSDDQHGHYANQLAYYVLGLG